MRGIGGVGRAETNVDVDVAACLTECQSELLSHRVEFFSFLFFIQTQ